MGYKLAAFHTQPKSFAVKPKAGKPAASKSRSQAEPPISQRPHETTFHHLGFRSNAMMHSNAINVNMRGICYRPNRPGRFNQERRGGRRPAERSRAAIESAQIRPNRPIAPLYQKNGRAHIKQAVVNKAILCDSLPKRAALKIYTVSYTGSETV